MIKIVRLCSFLGRNICLLFFDNLLIYYVNVKIRDYFYHNRNMNIVLFPIKVHEVFPFFN